MTRHACSYIPQTPPLQKKCNRYYTSRLEARELLDLRRRGLAKVQQALGRLKRTRDEFARRLEAAGEASLGELQVRIRFVCGWEGWVLE